MELHDILFEKKDDIATTTFKMLFGKQLYANLLAFSIVYFLPRLVGLGRAMQMLLTGEIIPAQHALNAGLLTHVVAQQQLMEYAINMAHTIASNAPLPVRLVKQTMQKTYDLDLEAVLQLEVDGMMQCLRSEDLVEGFNAFLEKRPPVYKDK